MKTYINNIMRKWKKGFSLIIYPLTFSVALASCSDWSDHYNGTDELEGGGQTLWNELQSNPQLSDFCEVLSNTMVFRHHKKTPVSYAQMLNGGQSFTVVAPLNGTFDKSALLQLVQTNQGDSVVEKSFIHNHLSRTTTSLNGEKQSMLLLNGKHAVVEAGKIEGVDIATPNIHASNGILHIANTRLPYRYNLYEALCDIQEFSNIGSFLRQYEEDYFDAENSVSSGIIEGVPVYVDSVVVERNRMLEQIGLINAEDSVYWVVAPSTQGWQTAWDMVKDYFVYDEKVLRRDSLQQFWTTRALLDDGIYNLTDQKSTKDSLISVQYNRRRPNWHVFYKPFEPNGILNDAEVVECSNGILYKTSVWPFTPEQTFFRELWTEGEDESHITAENLCSHVRMSVAADSISENSFLDVIPSSTTAQWSMTFKIDNNLSGTYDIAVVVLPQTVTGKKAANPNKFKATINYIDTNGGKKSFNCNNKQFETNPEKVDTVWVAEGFKFPTCNYAQEAIKSELKIDCSITSRENLKFAREMYIDCIYLRPHRE